MRPGSGFRTALLLGAAALLLVLAPSQAGEQTAGIVPPQARPYGASYGEWSARWWRWAFSLPVDHHPLYDTADCSAGQSGPVWFLGGTFTTIQSSPNPAIIRGIATRDCTVPNGKFLFFPLLNVECSTIEGNGTTEQELRV